MQAATAMAILSIISSLLTARFAVSDAGLVRAMGPRGFGTVSAVIGVTALVAAFGIIVGHYHSINPCDLSNTSLAEDARNSLGSGAFLALYAFTAIGAVEALWFVLIGRRALPSFFFSYNSCRTNGGSSKATPFRPSFSPSFSWWSSGREKGRTRAEVSSFKMDSTSAT